MRALSLHQPWPWAIFMLGKNVENRTWPVKLRGRILVHASKKYDHEGARWIEKEFGLVPPGPNDLPMGGVVGSVEIVDCVKKMDSKWFFGPFGFVLKDPEEMEFIPYKGSQRFFNVSIEVTP